MSYKSSDKMSTVITRNYTLLQVMSRFGLSLGFGDKTVAEVCEDSGVETQTFLDVVNFLADEGLEVSSGMIRTLHIPTLMTYLKNAHSYFLDFKFPK